MNIDKLSPVTQLILLYENLMTPENIKFITGQNTESNNWYLLISYFGEINSLAEKYNFQSKRITENLSYIYIPKANIGSLSEERSIISIEIPIIQQYILDASLPVICGTKRVLGSEGFNVSGEGILLGIIDSGIDYFHQDFRKEDGTTRILEIWDQTIEGIPPEGCFCGANYSEAQINEALRQETKLEGLKLVPSVDILGHGTAVAGIAAGNGRASKGKYTGVASGAELIVVKAGRDPEGEGMLPLGATNAQIILGIDYILQQAIKRDKPVAIISGFGINEGQHDGNEMLERYIDYASLLWRTNIVVGVGNQANKDSHASGVIRQGGSADVDIFIDEAQPYYYLVLVYGLEDELEVEMQSPRGEKTNILSNKVKNEAFILGSNSVLVNFTGPNVVTNKQQITIYIDKFEGKDVDVGTWKLKILGKQILDGSYNIWGTSINPLKRQTRFLNPDPFRTLTVPSTSVGVTSVGAFDGLTGQIANFSGRGKGLNEVVKPEIVAPGVGVIAPTSLQEDGYATVTGTSIAAAFMVGSYALFLEYGVKNQPNNYIFGEALKAYVVRNAQRSTQNKPYPNPSWGYGVLCIRATLEALKVLYNA